jgi:cyclopropane fatty-acyl-phospholipid synthase-like methyltransferase
MAVRLFRETFPRAASYNPRWILENQMGPNVLWLTEALSQVLDLQPDMRVLDMGCGKALSSVFMAQEFGVQVWAADLWIAPTENWQRIAQTDVADRVFPLHAEAHTLPFAEGFFDALVSLDSYQYYGTDDLYLDYFSRFVKEGGQIGIVVPGVRHELTEGVPEHLQPYWQADFHCWHSPDWWNRHWENSGKVEVTHSDFLPDGWKHWLLWGEICSQYGFVPELFKDWVPKEIEMLRLDAGRILGFSRLVARRTPP